MTLCPVAILTGCKNCPVVKICLLKSVIGDVQGEHDSQPDQPGDNQTGEPNNGD